MATNPTFSLTIGALRATTADPAGGPTRLVVDRDMDVPADALRLRLAERAGVELGDPVTVALGDGGVESVVFTGTVTGLRPAVAMVEVVALGSMTGLLDLRTSATWQGQTAGAVARDLIGQAGLSAGTVDDGPVLPGYAIDDRLSAYAHLKDLADRLGYELYADVDGNVMVHALGAAAGLDAVAAVPQPAGGERYAFGEQLLDAAAARQPSAWGAVEVGGESPMSGRGDRTAHWLTVNDADYRGTAGRGAPSLLVLDPAARTKDLADRFAAGRLAVAARTAHQLRVTVLGRPQVDLGATITAADVPEALAGGSGYVRAVRHRFGGDGGFLTDLRVSVEVRP